MRGPSQVGAGGAIITSIKKNVSQEPKLEMTVPSILAALERAATVRDQELNISAKPKGLEGIQYHIFPQIITVKGGDNLFRLTVKVYGDVNERLMEWVLINNPRIRNPAQIAVGQRIVFPEKPLDHEGPNRGNLGSRSESVFEETLPGTE